MRNLLAAAGLLVACGGEEGGGVAERLAPVLHTGGGCVVEELPGDHEGFVLHLNRHPDAEEPVTLAVKAYDADGRQIPHHMVGCERSGSGDLPRTTEVTLDPGAGCFPHFFLRDASRVDQILVFPERRRPIVFFQRGDPVCRAGSSVAPAELKLRYD